MGAEYVTAGTKPHRPFRHPADCLGAVGAARAIAPARLACILVAGIGLQIVIAGVMLNIPAVRAAFDWAASLVAALQAATNAGMRLVFGYLAGGPVLFEHGCGPRPASSWPSRRCR